MHRCENFTWETLLHFWAPQMFMQASPVPLRPGSKPHSRSVACAMQTQLLRPLIIVPVNSPLDIIIIISLELFGSFPAEQFQLGNSFQSPCGYQ